MMRKVTVMALMVLMMVVPSQAQTTWTCFYDFTTSDAGWTPGPVNGASINVTRNSSGWQDGLIGSALQFRGVGIQIAFGSVVTITDIIIDHHRVDGAGSSGSDVHRVFSTSPAAEWWQLPYYQAPAEPLVITAPPVSGVSSVDTLMLQIFSGLGTGGSDPGGDVVVRDITLQGTGTPPSPCDDTPNDYVKPLHSDDRDQIIENINQTGDDTDNTTYAFSYTPGANVFSAAAGTITEMRVFNPDTDCDGNFNTSVPFVGGNPCMVYIPGEASPYFPSGARSDTSAGSDLYLVRLLTDDGVEFTYFVEAADYYLSEGQQVDAGCILGRTFAVEPGSNPPEYLSEPGLSIVVVREGGSIIPAVAFFTIEPDEESACNVNPDNANCLGDVQLNDPAQWESSPGVMFNDPGFTILGGFDAHIRTTMNLDPDQMPELIVTVRATGGGNGNLELTLGQTTTPFSISEGTFQTVTIEGDAHLADGTFYTVRIKNDGTSNLDVQSVCVRFTEDGEGNPVENPDPPPDPCIFVNNSFNDGTGSWSVTSTEPGPGELRMASGGTAGQTITVPAGSYNLSIVAALWTYNSFTPDDQDTDDVDIEYDFPSGTGFTTLDTHTYGEFIQNNNLIVFAGTVVIASDTTGSFVFEVTLNSPATGVRGLAIRSICLDDGSGGGGDGSGDDDGVFNPSCGTISTPTGSGIGTWISWQWAQLNKFYRCELMILLNSLYTFMKKSWITTTWTMRWTQAATVKTANWFGRDFIGWLGGHLSNIAVGQVTTITGVGGESCGNVFCLLQSLVQGFESLGNSIVNGITEVLGSLIESLTDLLTQVLGMLQQIMNFIFGLIGLVVNIAVDLVGLLIRLIGMAAQIFGLLIQAIVTVINAWVNAVPEPIFPSCNTDQSTARCMIFYVAERTVFTQSGALFIPTIAGGMYLSLILWVIGKLKSWLMEVGALS